MNWTAGKIRVNHKYAAKRAFSIDSGNEMWDVNVRMMNFVFMKNMRLICLQCYVVWQIKYVHMWHSWRRSWIESLQVISNFRRIGTVGFIFLIFNIHRECDMKNQYFCSRKRESFFFIRQITVWLIFRVTFNYSCGYFFSLNTYNNIFF